MISKARLIFVLAIFAVSQCAGASAESTRALASVQVGLIEKGRWGLGRAIEPTDYSKRETSCTPAEFEGTSDCGAVVISNNSPDPITIKFTTDEDFAVGVRQNLIYSSGPQPCYEPRSLQPGASCFAPIEFWPRTGEPHHATIRVTVSSVEGSATTSLKVVGTSDYPPELQAAEEVRERHVAELKKIPHVASVELDNEDGIKINVTVDAPTEEIRDDEIEEVRKRVPPKIEGYDTEVTEYTHRGYAF